MSSNIEARIDNLEGEIKLLRRELRKRNKGITNGLLIAIKSLKSVRGERRYEK